MTVQVLILIGAVPRHSLPKRARNEAYGRADELPKAQTFRDQFAAFAGKAGQTQNMILVRYYTH